MYHGFYMDSTWLHCQHFNSPVAMALAARIPEEGSLPSVTPRSSAREITRWAQPRRTRFETSYCFSHQTSDIVLLVPSHIDV